MFMQWRRRRQQRSAKLLLGHAAFVATRSDPASQHYWDKIYSQKLQHLTRLAETLGSYVGPELVWSRLSALSCRSHRMTIWLLALIPGHVLAQVFTAVTDMPRVLPTLGPVYLAGASIVGYVYTGAVCRRLHGRLVDAACMLGLEETAYEKQPAVTGVLGRSWRRALRRHAHHLPARAVMRSDLLALAARDHHVPDDVVEVARVLAADFDGTAHELLHTARRLADG
jgi:hypothetical protein